MKLLLVMGWTLMVHLAVAAEEPVEPDPDCEEMLRQLTPNEWGYPMGLAGSELPKREEPPLDEITLEEFYLRYLGDGTVGETDRSREDAKSEGSGGETDHDEGL